MLLYTKDAIETMYQKIKTNLNYAYQNESFDCTVFTNNPKNNSFFTYHKCSN